jgi:hypothetical protein
LYKGLWKSYKKYIRIMKQSYIRWNVHVY